MTNNITPSQAYRVDGFSQKGGAHNPTSDLDSIRITSTSGAFDGSTIEVWEVI